MMAFTDVMVRTGLRSWLRLTVNGRQLLAMLEGDPQRTHDFHPNRGIATRLKLAMRMRVIRQGALAERVRELFDAGHRQTAEFLLETGLQALPEATALAGVKIARLQNDGRIDQLRAYIADLLKHENLAPRILHHIIVALAGSDADDDAQMRSATARFAQSIEISPDRANVEAQLYEALGLPAYAELLRSEETEQSFGAIAGPAAQSEPVESVFAGLLYQRPAGAGGYAAQNRLLFVGNSLACGGMERVLARSYRHFSEAADVDTVDLALIEYDPDGPTGFYAGEAGVTVDDVLLLDRLTPPGELFERLPGSWGARGRKLFDHIVKTRPRAIHAWNDLTGALSAYAGLLAGCPRIVIHFHHNPAVPLASPYEPVASYPAIYRMLASRPEIRFVFCARAAALAYADWWTLPVSGRFATLYNGFDWPKAPSREAARARLGVPADAPIIGTVLRFDPVKQPLLWAEAAVALGAERPDAHFLMVGDGPQRMAVIERFARAGLGGRVHLPGQITGIADYYAAMDVFWLTSQSEGLPNVSIEAQFAGVPVVAFDVGGMAETIVPGESGLLVPPDDPAALVEVTRGLLANDARRANMSARASENARRTFSAARFYASLSQIYGD